jgi:ribonuclease R
MDLASLSEIGAQISAAERRAMTAERETVDRLIAYFLADRVGETFTGHISGATRAGLFVKLDDSGADGFVPMRSLGREHFRYHEDRHAVVGANTGQSHRLGDKVVVKLVEAAPVAGALRFELLSEAIPQKQPKRRRDPSRPRAARLEKAHKSRRRHRR